MSRGGASGGAECGVRVVRGAAPRPATKKRSFRVRRLTPAPGLRTDRGLEDTEERVELQLQLGSVREAIVELETLVDAHPLRERLRGQLMIALYRAGRQADALRAFQDGRNILAEELGLDPGPELRRL